MHGFESESATAARGFGTTGHAHTAEAYTTAQRVDAVCRLHLLGTNIPASAYTAEQIPSLFLQNWNSSSLQVLLLAVRSLSRLHIVRCVCDQ
jgi:hypothetical protein